MMSKLCYDDLFYNTQSGPSSRSAFAVVPILQSLLEPKSVVDIGCGVGTWLRAFIENGVEDILGIDGAYVNREKLHISQESFLSMDLSFPDSQIYRKFDLAISLEVAEHVPESSAVNLIAFITSLAPVVFFSAAVPGQGGGGGPHINEQWPDYWIEKFSCQGYKLFDVIRSKIWDNPQVEPWYCQNSFLFVKGSCMQHYPQLLSEKSSYAYLPLRVIHPELFHRYITHEYINSKQLLGTLLTRIKNKLL